MATAYNYLVVLFASTPGQRGPYLGSDECEVVFLVWMVIDVETNKVVSVKQSFVKADHTEVSEEYCSELGIKEEAIKNAEPLESVIQQLDTHIRNELNSTEGATFCFCIDGSLHLRQCLHPQCANKGIELPEHYYQFFDIRKEFRRFYTLAPQVNSLKEMADHLKIDITPNTRHATGDVRAIGLLVQRLISDGHKFTSPEIIQRKFETGTCNKHEIVDNDHVIKARGLPWQSSDKDVAKFFKGLDIGKGGVALCLNPQGRRNGEALVRFTCTEHRDLALQRHKHHLGHRYIEVYKATGEEFLKIAAGSSSEASNFLAKDNGHIIVRMRGLPFTATAKDVLVFFGDECPVSGAEEGVLFVRYPDGRSTGDAFVLFSTEANATSALAKHKENLGSRYIELFRSTTAEVQQVLSRYQQHPLIPNGPPPTGSVPILPQQMITSGSVRDCIRMRGLPFSASVEDIMKFLGEFAHYIRPHGVHMVLNQQGRPSGDAFIQMISAEKALHAAQQCHRKHMGERYIEVFQCSGDEMNFVLMGGTLNRGGLSPPAGAIPAQAQFTPYPGTIPSPPAATVMAGTLPMPPRPPAPAYYAPPLYYFPSPPVSPTSQAYYQTPNGAVVRMRGLPFTTSVNDIVSFFQGYGN
uniref:Epithelial splicing regulatory protein 2-like isoform X1 n=1 Tax=Saccoglossus kowalevskii TaxID=10224 RepID=A0ABM0GS37_SACKO|nr:PREDICTED: epithelial splicing regulatory protein 2-like isoform X1 [Saccoglossus kowalevskii]